MRVLTALLLVALTQCGKSSKEEEAGSGGTVGGSGGTVGGSGGSCRPPYEGACDVPAETKCPVTYRDCHETQPPTSVTVYASCIDGQWQRLEPDSCPSSSAGGEGGSSGVAGTDSQAGRAGSSGSAGTSDSGGAAGAGGATGGFSGAGGGEGGIGGEGGSAGSSGDVCEGAVEGEPCNAEGRSCGGEACTDPCIFCSVLSCEAGIWRRYEAAPAPCFECGATEHCMSYVEYCRIDRGVTLVEECVPLPPDSCQADLTCECLLALEPERSCTEAGEGEFTLERCCG